LCAERLVVWLRNDVAFRTVIQPHYTQHQDKKAFFLMLFINC
jgi:hypothetical protein